MNEEERLKRNAYMREYMKRYISNMTPEEKEAYRSKRRNQEKRRHANSPTSLEKHRKAKREYMRRQFAKLSPKERRERSLKEIARKRLWRELNPEARKAEARESYYKNPERSREVRRQYGQRLKLAVLNAYGNICKCCGEDEPVFLSIDHIKGDGARHRKEEIRKSGMSFYVWLKNNGYPEGFQVLCMNCNVAKRTGDECPHRKIVMSRILANISKKGGGA